MSKLSDALLELRMKAGGRPGWNRMKLRHGLALAMRKEEGELHFVLHRSEVMPSIVEERVCLENLMEELAPRTRTRYAKKNQVLYVLRKHVCPSCSKPLDVLAKMKLREHCSYCAENEDERPCKGCGIMVGIKGSWVDWCSQCAEERRRN